jgi:hypothetical protein
VLDEPLNVIAFRDDDVPRGHLWRRCRFGVVDSCVEFDVLPVAQLLRGDEVAGAERLEDRLHPQRNALLFRHSPEIAPDAIPDLERLLRHVDCHPKMSHRIDARGS